MSELAHGDVQAVADVQSAVVRFARDAEEVRTAARRAAADVLGRLSAEVVDRRRVRDQARRALDACRSQEDADCAAAATALAVAEERLRTAERAFREGGQAAERFTPRDQGFGRAVEELARDVVAVTRGQQRALEGYLSAGGARGGGGGFAGGSTGGGTAGGTGSSLPGGVQMISLDLIDNPHGGVSGPGDFTKGYSPEDLAWALEALHEVVLPAVRAGKGADYFAERDQRTGLMGSRSYHDTYTGFFGGNDAIRLDPAPGGRYTVGNGRHRIWVARQMGVTSIPARTA